MIIILLLSMQKRLSKTFETILHYLFSNPLMANQNLLQLTRKQMVDENDEHKR